MNVVPDVPTAPASTEPVRVKRLGDAPGKIIELRETSNTSGGRLAIVQFADPVGERSVYLSGRAINRMKAKPGEVCTFTAYKMSDESINITAKSLSADEASEVFN